MWELEHMDGKHLAKAVFALFLGLSAALTEKAFAETTAQLSLKPERCVALNEGQTCYQNVTVNWQSRVPANYCLFEESSKTPIVCWENAIEGEVKVEFASETNQTYRLYLSKTPTKKDLAAETEMVVTWVYSDTKKRRNRWRLF